MRVDGLIHHQPALVETKHGPAPIIVSLLDLKTQHSAVKVHACGHTLDWEHGDQSGHFHGTGVRVSMSNLEPIVALAFYRTIGSIRNCRRGEPCRICSASRGQPTLRPSYSSFFMIGSTGL